jgi:hypothetical protein
LLHCHVFQIKAKGIEITKAIGQAFKAGTSTGSFDSPLDAGTAGAQAPPSNAPQRQASVTAVPPSDIQPFDAFYLGYQKVDKAIGAAVVQVAVKKTEEDAKATAAEEAKQRSKSGRRESKSGPEVLGDAVTVVITPQSIRIVERLSGDTVLNVFIRQVRPTRRCMRAPPLKSQHPAA